MKIYEISHPERWKIIGDKDLWYKIEEELGTVTDVHFDNTPESPHSLLKMTYKSNGIDKVAFFNGSFKVVIQSLLYCVEEFSAKK